MNINSVVRIFVAAIVLCLLAWCAKLLIAAIGAPAIVWTIVLVLLVLVFVVYLCNEFGIFKS
jgi:hypothetical protein